jgi:ATP-dependent Lon protease
MVDVEANNIESIEGDISDAGKAANHQLVIPSDVLPSVLYVLPLSHRPFFPSQAQSLALDREHWEETLQQVVENKENQPVIGLLYCGEQEPL